MSSIWDVTLWFGCKSLGSSSCFCCVFIFYVFMPMMSSHWKLIWRRLLSELQLRFNFCTNVLFSGSFFFLSHKCEYCRGLFSPTVQRLSESTCLCWTLSSQCCCYFSFFGVISCLTLVSNTELIPSTGLNKGGRGLSTSCTKTEPNQPRVAPPPLYDDVIWNQSPHGDAWG